MNLHTTRGKNWIKNTVSNFAILFKEWEHQVLREWYFYLEVLHGMIVQYISSNLHTSSRLVAEIGKPPDVAETDTVADAREHELCLRVPLDPLLVRLQRTKHG